MKKSCVQPFANMILECVVLALGRANIHERLDRSLCNRAWFLFLDFYVRHVPRTLSDHLLLLLYARHDNVTMRREKSFKMLTTWLYHPSFLELVEGCWANQLI